MIKELNAEGCGPSFSQDKLHESTIRELKLVTQLSTHCLLNFQSAKKNVDLSSPFGGQGAFIPAVPLPHLLSQLIP